MPSFFDDLTPDDAYAVHGVEQSGPPALTGPAPTAGPEESSLFGTIAGHVWRASGIPTVLETGRKIDVGLGKGLSSLVGQPSEQPFSEQVSTAMFPSPGAPPSPLRGQVPFVFEGAPPEKQAMLAAVGQPITQNIVGMSVDPVAWAPLGALMRFGKPGQAIGAAISAGFAGNMGVAGVQAAAKAKELFDREGVTPDTIRAATEAFMGLGLSAFGGLAAGEHIRQFRAPAAAPGAAAPQEVAPEGAAMAPPPRPISTSVADRINAVFENAKGVMDERVAAAAGGREGAVPPEEVGLLPTGVTEAPKVNLVLITPEVAKTLPPRLAKKGLKSRAWTEQDGTIYIGRKGIRDVLSAKTTEEALDRAVRLLSHEYMHGIEIATGARGATRTFNPLTGEEIQLPRSPEGRPLDPRTGKPVTEGGRAPGGHARGETYQDIPTDISGISRAEALYKAVRSDPRMADIYRIASQNPEIAAALQEAGPPDILSHTYSPEVTKLWEGLVGRGAGLKGKKLVGEAAAPELAPREGEGLEAGAGRSNVDIAADMVRERSEGDKRVMEELADRLIAAKYIPESAKAELLSKASGEAPKPAEALKAPPKVTVGRGPAEVIKSRTDRWRGVDYEERTKVYKRLLEMGGPTKENLAKLGTTPEEFKSWHLANDKNWHRQRAIGKIDPRAQAMRDIYTSKEFRSGVPLRETGLSPRQLGTSPEQQRAIAEGREGALPPSKALPGTEGSRLREVQQTASQIAREAARAIHSKDPKTIADHSARIGRVKEIINRIKGVFPWTRTQQQNLENITTGLSNKEARLANAFEKERGRAAREQAKAIRAPRGETAELKALREEVAQLREQIAKRRIKKPVKAAEEIEAKKYVPGEEESLEAGGGESLIEKVLKRKKSLEEKEIEKQRGKTLPSILGRVRRTAKAIREEVSTKEPPPAIGPVTPKYGPVGKGGIRESLLRSPEERARFDTVQENLRMAVLGKRFGAPETKPILPEEAKLTDAQKAKLRKTLIEQRIGRISAEEAYSRIRGELSQYQYEQLSKPLLTEGKVEKIPGKEPPKKYIRPGILGKREVPAGGRMVLRGGKWLASEAGKAAGVEGKFIPTEPLEKYTERLKGEPAETYETFEGPTSRVAITREVPEGPKEAAPTALGKGAKPTPVAPPGLSKTADIQKKLAKLKLLTTAKASRESRLLTRAKEIMKLPGNKLTLEEAKAVAERARRIGSNAVRIGDKVYSLNDLTKSAKEAFSKDLTPRFALEEREPVAPVIPGKKASQALTGYKLDKEGNVVPSEGGSVSLADIAKASPSEAAFIPRLDTFIDGLHKRGLLTGGEPTATYRNRALNYFKAQKPGEGIKAPPAPPKRGLWVKYGGRTRPVEGRISSTETPRERAERVLGGGFEAGGGKPINEDLFHRAGQMLRREGLGETYRTHEIMARGLLKKAGVVKSFVTGADLSNPFRQTLALTASQTFRDPVGLARNLKEMVLSYSEGRYKKYDAALKQSPKYKMAKAAGVNLIEVPAEHEAFLGIDLIDKAVTKGRTKPWVDPRKWLSELGEKAIVGAARAYTHYQNEAMADGFARGVKFLSRHGDLSEKSISTLADFINVVGSRTPVRSAALSKVGQALFFSPQMMKARGRFLLHVMLDHGFGVRLNEKGEAVGLTKPIIGFRTYESKAARKYARQTVRDTIMFGATLLGLGYTAAKARKAVDPSAPEPHIELNPYSTDWGKLRIGHVAVDPWGGYQQYFRFAMQQLFGKEKLRGSGRVQEARRAELAGRFLRSKLAPLPGLVTSAIAGRTAEGREMKSFHGWLRAIGNTVTPLMGQDTADILRENPDLFAPVLIAMAAGGIGVQAGAGSKGSWIGDEATRQADVRVSDEIARLRLEPPRISGRVSLPGRTSVGARRYYTLSPAERETFLGEVMPIVSRELDDFISSPRYQALSDEAKRRVLYRIVSKENRRYSAAKRLKRTYRYAPAKNEWWESEQEK